MSNDPPYTRSGDPETSHEAEEAARLALREDQATVERYARERGAEGFTDWQMHRDLEDDTSTYRSRRADLVARRILVDSGNRRREPESSSPQRNRVVWVHREFRTNVGPVLTEEEARKRPRGLSADLQAEAALHANRLESAVKTVRGYGLVGCEQIMNDAVELLRRFGP